MIKTILFTAISLCAFAAEAQIPQPDPDTTAKHFLIVASIGNLQEVSSGQLAVQKAQRSEVKAFGQMMVKDHSEAEQELLALAKSRNITLPSAATGGIQPDIPLKNAGADFDKLYVHAMVSGHGGTVQSFAAYAINGKDPVVKAWAKEMLPKLKTHLDYITVINQAVNNNIPFVTVNSAAFMEGGMIPAKYSCEGGESSPPLIISHIPPETKTLALIVHDPDAPKVGGVTHWVVWNLPLNGQIPENFKGGVQGQNTDNKPGYKGVCPPDGTHHYNFTIYALNVSLNLGTDADKTALEKAMEGHIIAEGLLSGLYPKIK